MPDICELCFYSGTGNFQLAAINRNLPVPIPIHWRKNVAVAQIEQRRVQLRFGGRGTRCARFVVGLPDDYLAGSVQRVLLEFVLLLL